MWQSGRKAGVDVSAEDPFPATSPIARWNQRGIAIPTATINRIARKGANIPVPTRNKSFQWTIPSQSLTFPIH